MAGRSALTRSAWSGWKLGFSSSSPQAQEDKQGAEGGAAAAAGQEAAPPGEQPEAETATPEELRAALAACQEETVTERKKVRGVWLILNVFIELFRYL